MTPPPEPPQAQRVPDSPPAGARSLTLRIDRHLGIPVGVQLRGQIEYGIACGEIERGARLPSVRELAGELGLAHMTVVQVYKELLSLGLIVTHPGRGTFVAHAPLGSTQDSAQNMEPLRQLLSSTLEQAEDRGYTQRQVMETLNMLISRPAAAPMVRAPVEVLLVGLFLDATSGYAQALQGALPPGDRVRAVTLEELRHAQVARQARRADVVLGLAHRLLEIQALLPGVSIIPVNFIPSEATRQALASLDPLSRLVVVATFEEFLPTFLQGVGRFAPHVSQLRAAHIRTPDLAGLLGWADVVVYASGAEMVRELSPGIPNFEYRHTIDPRDVQARVLPAVDACRGG